MNVLATVLAVALTASPVPGEPAGTPDPELVTPGTIGFLVTFAVAVSLFLLVRDMNRRVQRIQVRGDRGGRGGRGDEDGTGPATDQGPGRPDDDPPSPVRDLRGR